MLRTPNVLAIVCVLCGCAGPNSADPKATKPVVKSEPTLAKAVEQAPQDSATPEAKPKLLEHRVADSVSLGGPTNGRLENGVPLRAAGPGFIHNPKRTNAGARYGTLEMVSALESAAARVAKRLPGSTLIINDLGLEQGGPIPHHGSHQNGRDVDVLFYLLDKKGKPRRSLGIPLDPEGKGHDYGDLLDEGDDVPVRFDVARSWEFLQSLLVQEKGELQRIFVVEHIRTLLMDYAEAQAVPSHVRKRLGSLMCQPNYPHDDHFHIRFFCAAEDIAAGCEDSYPIYSWHRAELRKLGVKPVLAKRTRKKKPRVTSLAKARKEAGPMHKNVKAFLDRRAQWSKKPHPGRRWCP